MDYVVRGTSKDGSVRFFGAYTRDTVEFARSAHNLSPVVTAALGRLLTGGTMMGQMMKGDKDILSLIIRGNGPVGSLTVTADSKGFVKGYPGEPLVNIPANSRGKLDVASAVGEGTLTVVKDLGLKEPYNATVDLVSGEIGEDLTYYFATSEQIPSTVGLGVLLNKTNTVRHAGGFIVQVMPNADEKTVSRIEENLKGISSITRLLDEGKTIEDIISLVLSEIEIRFLEKTPVGFRCNCSRERMEKDLISIGEGELNGLIEEGEEIELKCNFCQSAYTFSVDELKEMLKKAK